MAPDGTYEFQLQTASNSIRSVQLSLAGDVPGSAAHLLNWAEAQAIISNAPFTLQWSGFVGATSNDYVAVEISGFDTYFHSGQPGEPGALAGDSTQLTIPAGVMRAGTSLQLSITFIRTVAFDTNSFPGVILHSSVRRETVTQLRTLVAASPTFAALPQSQTARGGSNVTFSVTASSETPVTYEWFKNAERIPGATNALLTLTDVRRIDRGTYTAVVSNAFGSVQSVGAELQVLVPQQMHQPEWLAEGRLRLHFGDNDGGRLNMEDMPNFAVQASANLADWQTLPDALVLTNGLLRVETSVSSSPGWRFTGSLRIGLHRWAVALAVRPLASDFQLRPNSSTRERGCFTAFHRWERTSEEDTLFWLSAFIHVGNALRRAIFGDLVAINSLSREEMGCVLSTL